MEPRVARKKIVVLGTGYVGLPAALMLARAGHDVIGVDTNPRIVASINDGQLLINDEGLKEIIAVPEVRSNLRAQSIPCEADVFLIAVPTALDERMRVADMSNVLAAVESILPHLHKENLIVLESTVPPLTCREVLTPLLEKTGLKVGRDIHLAHCPERILPGNVLHEIVHNDRIIGAADEVTRRMACEMYRTFVKGELLETDDVTAELCKLMENTYRDVNVALANELAAVCEGLGVSASEAFALTNRHPRVNILKPGIGVGGHCIPIDPYFIKQVDPLNSRLIATARLVNDEVPHRVAAKIRKAVRDVTNPRIVAVGASYKAETEDTRESPAVEIVALLREDGYEVIHVDPLVVGMGYSSLAEVASGADCVAFLVPHRAALAELARERRSILNSMRTPIILEF